MVINVDVNADYVMTQLGKMQKKAPMVIRSAVNDTAKDAKKQNDKLTKRTYTAKGSINPLKYTAATVGNLTAVLRDRGRNISISHFSTYAGKRAVTAVINRNHGRQIIGKYGNKAFSNDLANGGSGIAVRVSASRLPIEKMASISSPVMHGNKQTWGTIEDAVHQSLYRNIQKRLEGVI